MSRLLALVGPTASGKSQAALVLAQRLGGEIVSADSRQIYRYLDIGTAKPSISDRRKVPHHFVDILDPAGEYSAGQFGNEARECIKEILDRGKIPILVGGSGLYVRAVIDGFFKGPGKDPEIRLQLEKKLKEDGGESLLKTLREVDPVSASVFEASKPRRIIRALEVFYITGKRLSDFHKEQSSRPAFEVVQVGISWPKELLYKRINDRVDWMFSEGLVDEVRRLQQMGYRSTLNALNSVGYKEVYELLEGRRSLGESIELVKRNTRRFAKRQGTWFKADQRIIWIRASEREPMEHIASAIAKEFTVE